MKTPDKMEVYLDGWAALVETGPNGEMPDTITLHVTTHKLDGKQETVLKFYRLTEEGDYLKYKDDYIVLGDAEFKKWAEGYHAETIQTVRARADEIIEQLKVA